MKTSCMEEFMVYIYVADCWKLPDGMFQSSVFLYLGLANGRLN